MKVVVLIVFAGWASFCVKWYVCDIHQACLEKPTSVIRQTDAPRRDSDHLEVVLPAPPPKLPSAAPPPTTLTPEVKPKSAEVEEPRAKQLPSKAAKRPFSGKPINPSRVEIIQAALSAKQGTVYFPATTVGAAGQRTIEQLLKPWAEQVDKKKTIVVTGYSDFVGDETTKLEAGLRRAEMVRNALVAVGIPRNKIQCETHGDQSKPGSNDTPKGRYLNRKVVLKIYP